MNMTCIDVHAVAKNSEASNIPDTIQSHKDIGSIFVGPTLFNRFHSFIMFYICRHATAFGAFLSLSMLDLQLLRPAHDSPERQLCFRSWEWCEP